MVSTATDTMQDITHQADALHAQVVQIQSDNEANLAKQRAIFEHQLKKQERANHAINGTNAHIRTEIVALQVGNIALKKHASDLQKSNERYVSEINTLESKVGISKDFLAASLKQTDTTKPVQPAPVHETAAPAHHDEEKRSPYVHFEESNDDAEDSTDDVDDTKTSFLALKSKTHLRSDPAANPSDLINALSKRVQSFAAQALGSQATLSAAFNSTYATGENRRVFLLAEQMKLNASRNSLLSQQFQLQESDDHLKDTKNQYEQRLRGFGLFMQRLAHVALAPENMAPQLMQDLPDSVAIPTALVKATSK